MNDILAEELLDKDNIIDSFSDDAIDPRDALLNEINNMQTEVVDVKNSIDTLKTVGDPVTNGNFFNEMSDLASRANSVLDSCKQDIERSSILDADLVAAYAALIKSTHEIISDYLDIYRDRQKHINKIELEELKQEHRKEIIRMKDDMDKSIHSDTEERKMFVQEAVVEVLSKQAKYTEDK